MIAERFALAGDVALVTGGGRGLGRAIAEALAEAGAGVVVCDLSGDSAAAVAESLVARGAKAIGVAADVTDERAVESTIGAALSWCGRLDVLVNNAGVTMQRPAEELSLEEWNRVLAVNLTAAFLCSKHAARPMIGAGRGRIVNIASIHAVVAPAFHCAAAYAASKSGLLGLTRALAVEWGKHGIRVNAVCPTYARTEMTRERFADPDYYRKIVERTPIGRVAEPEDIASAVLYLASPASGMVTGVALNVDGGWVVV